jgi:hypothetical protein
MVILQLGFDTFSVFTRVSRKRSKASIATPACSVFRTKSDNSVMTFAFDHALVYKS